MMMDAAGTGRFYHFVPEQHVAMVQNQAQSNEFPTTMHLQFEEGYIRDLEAKQVSKMFERFGDFYLQKDTHDSVYMEFFFIDPATVASRTMAEVVQLMSQADPKIRRVSMHTQAPKFKSHNMYDGN